MLVVKHWGLQPQAYAAMWIGKRVPYLEKAIAADTEVPDHESAEHKRQSDTRDDTPKKNL